MKNFLAVFLTAWATLACTLAIAQTNGAKITGTVFDAAQKPVDGATVVLAKAADSSTVKTLLANPDGSFVFAGLKEGDYRLVVSFVGYKTYKSDVLHLHAGQSLSMPAIGLIQVSTALKEVAVTAQKALIEQKIDRTVVNVSAMISANGANALEVLEKSPGVQVDQDGNITFKGKSGVMVLIDDKPTYLSGDNLANYLKSIPASQLDQIELMTNPPAKYDASGNAGVINIKLKKSKARGFNGSVNASIGDAAFWRTQESINLNYHEGKINLFANGGYGIQKNYRRLDVGRTYFDAAGNVSSGYTEAAFFYPVTYNRNLKTGIDYYVSPKTTLGVVLTGSLSTGHNFNPVNSFLTNKAGNIDSNEVADNNTQSKFYNGGINLNYSHKFDSLGKELSFDLDYLKYHSGRDQTFNNNSYNAAGALASTQNIADNLPANIDIYAAKTDYTRPLKNKGKIEAGLKTSFVNTDNAANYFNVLNNISTVDNDNTNHFLYQENVNAAYFNFSKEYTRLTLQAGLRAENTEAHGHQLGNARSPDSSFTQRYTSLFPTAYLLYKINPAGTYLLNLSYGRRIDRPYYQDLNPFVTILDKYSAFVGNPFLKPQYSSNYNLTYSYKSVYELTLHYSYISDYQVESDYQQGNVFVASSTNLGHSISAGVTGNVTLNPFKWWNFYTYAEVINRSFSGQLFNSGLQAAHTYTYIRVNNQFTLGKGYSLELSAVYVSPTLYGQFVNIPRKQFDAGLQKKILSNKGTLRLSARDIFRSNFSAGTINNVPGADITFHNDNANRAVTLGFSYNFGSTGNAPKKRTTGSADTEAGRVRN